MLERSEPRQSNIIVITGLPCTGKSMLAAQLQQHFRWPVFAKDAIKETLFDVLGWSDRQWSRRLSDASYALLFNLLDQTARSRTHAIVEANFRAEHALRFAALYEQHAVKLIQVMCATEGELLKRRFIERARSGKRHPGHVDQEAYRELEPLLAKGRDSLILGAVDEVIQWDTTSSSVSDIAPLLKRIEAVFGIDPCL